MNTVKTLLAVILVFCFTALSLAALHPENRHHPVNAAVRLMDDPPLPPADMTDRITTYQNRGPVRSTDELDALWQVGTTYYDFFSYGAHNRFIARDRLGGLHAAWMNALTTAAGTRNVSYSFRNPGPSTMTWSTSASVFPTSTPGAAFSTIDVDSIGKAIIGAHHPITGGYPTVIGVDDGYQIGAFNEIQVAQSTDPFSGQVIWPILTVDRTNRAHVFGRARDTSNTYSYSRIWYTRTDTTESSAQTYSYAFNTFMPSFGSATSRISNKVAVAWPQITVPDGYNAPGGWAARPGFVYLATMRNNDVMIAQSTDNGQTWNFNNPSNNITHFRTWSNEVFARTGDTSLAAGDTMRHFVSTSMVYDNNDNLHIVFGVNGLFEDGTIDTTVTHGPPISGYYPSACYVYHWTEIPALRDTFSIVADGMTALTQSQAWRSAIDRMSLSVASNNNELYCAFTRYAYDDTSANTWPCGTVLVTHSTNNGLTWYHPTTITDTITPGLASGQAHSNIWPSMPEVVDNDSLYIMYIDDRSGGSAWIESSTLGSDWTLNQVYVKSVPRSSIRSDSSLIYPTYPPLHRQDWYTKAPEAREPVLPTVYRVSAFPNPFNPYTTVRLSMPIAGRVAVKVYDVNGRQVATLADEKYPAGEQRIQWRPLSLGSGVYFIRMNAGNTVKTEKVVFMK